MSDFVVDLLEATKESESPRSFYYWSALTAISAAVRGQVYVSTFGGMVKYYPNLYVLLIAKAGGRKAHPVKLAESLVDESHATRVISGRSSFQSIIKELSSTQTSPNGGPPFSESFGYIVNDEFSTSLVRDPDALTILTTLYDRHKIWRNTLKHEGKEVLKNTYITMLGAMNHTHFRDIITQKELEGGFISRCIVVTEDRRNKINDGMDDFIPTFDESKLVPRLIEISKLKGEMKLTEAAKSVYRPWYKQWTPEDFEDRTGTASRLHVQMIKVATLLSLSHRDDLVIDKEEMEKSMNACFEVTKSTSKTTMTTDGDLAKKTGLILKALLDREDHKMTKRQILSKFWSHGIDSGDLEKIVQTFDDAGMINKEVSGGTYAYELKESVVERYASFKKAN